MIYAYLDESGMHGDAHDVAVGTYAGSHREWEVFARRWAQVLVRHGVDIFHAKDRRCDPLRWPLFELMSARDIRGWLVTVSVADFKAHASDELRSTLGNAYAVAAYACGLSVAEWAERRGDALSVVIEAGQPNVGFVRAMLEGDFGTAPIAAVTVARKADAVPLQVADFLAHCAGVHDRAWLHRLIGPGRGKTEHAHLAGDEISQLSRSVAGIWDRYRREKARQRAERRVSAPSTPHTPEDLMTKRRSLPAHDRADLETVRDRLAPLVAALDEILTLLGEGRSVNLVGPTKHTIHERYRTVKRALEAAYRRGDTQRGRDALTPAERAFWQPNVHQAFTELRAPVNSTDRAALFSCVYEARFTLGHALDDVRHVLGDEGR